MNLLANAGLILDLGRSHIPRSNWARAQLLSQHSRALELQPLSLHAQQMKSMLLETMLPNEGSPCTATKSSLHLLEQEKAHMQQQRPSAAKNKQTFFIQFIVI